MTIGEIKNLCPDAETYELKRYHHYVLILPHDVSREAADQLKARLAEDGIPTEIVRRTAPNADDHK